MPLLGHTENTDLTHMPLLGGLVEKEIRDVGAVSWTVRASNLSEFAAEL